MTGWLAIPMVLQAGAMLVDELFFHRRRGLPRWERVGHPIDTLSVLGCYCVSLALPPTQASLTLYVGLAALSCLLVTKDEFVHAARCEPGEQWLHSLLFILHPVVLGSAALLWLSEARTLLWLSACLTAAFGLYQALYWNVPWTKVFRSPSTTRSTTSSENVGTPPTTTRSRSYAPNPGSETPG
ncbi:MAG TPA: hypothetical protein VEX18_21415 [Polyangiaceae bacterium]|nr:hypothetical protein [Polyangiaceae bacterium]